MARLRIVAQGESDQVKANSRGRLFEKIIAEVMRCYGYDIDEHRANVTHAGMELDIEGKTSMTGIPVYGECKCYSSDVGCEKLQTFMGKYMPQWFKDNKSHGLFVAIPGVNSHAMGYYRDNCEANHQITVRLLQEPQVLEALIKGKACISDQEVAERIDPIIGTPGDSILICSDKGFFWLQLIVPIGAGIASKIQIFDALGHLIDDQSTIEYLTDLVPEIKEFEISIPSPLEKQPVTTLREDLDEVVEIRGSSACFEYQFPASPEFFVGRTELLSAIDEHVVHILDGQTSSRGILFEANSGWGKSSLVLATMARVQRNGHYAIAIDSRSASSSQFVLKTVQYALDKFGDFNGLISERPTVTGFEGALRALTEIGDGLRPHGKLLFIFFDQFENIFYLLDLLIKIAQLCLKIADAQTNVVLGFSWKTDLVGMTREFPYRWRDALIESCRTIRLKQFSEVETNALLDRLAKELHTPLRKDLRFLLSEFSQGYPWLLKKLCAHVQNQRLSGIGQAEMARGLLKVEQLFLEDLEGLTSHEEEALRRIAGIAPVNVSDLGEEFTPEIVQSLVNRRLIVKVGTKYDAYWDIFRDYLNTGKLPIQEIFLLRAQVGSILKSINILQRAGGQMDVAGFKTRAGLSDGAFLNIARDLRLLNLTNIEGEIISLSITATPDEQEIINSLRVHLSERLPRNRSVHAVLRILRERTQISLDHLATVLRDEFPYISAVEKTWKTYARILATWLDLSDLAIFDNSKSTLLEYRVGSQIRERKLSLAPKRSAVNVPLIHFAPIVQVATRLTSAAQRNEPIDWSGISRTSIYKSLSMLEEIKLISRKSTTIYVSPECYDFVSDRQKRTEIGKKCVNQWPIFNDLMVIMNDNRFMKLPLKQIGQLLIAKCNVDWKATTAEINAKIMLDWARHLGLAPGTYAYSFRGRFKSKISDAQRSLFEYQNQSNKEKNGEPATEADR